VAVVLADQIVASGAEFAADQPAPLSVRVSPLEPSPFGAHGGAIAIARGEKIDEAQAAWAQSIPSASTAHWFALYGLVLVMLLAWSGYLRTRHWGRLLRNQLTTLGALVILALSIRALFLLTGMSVLAAPVALAALLVGRRASKGSAVASAALMAMLVAGMVPLDLGIAIALLLQGVVPALLLPRNPRPGRIATALAAGGLASSAAYGLAFAAAWQTTPSLANPLHSTWVAPLFAAAASGILLFLLRPLFDWSCGEVSKRTLGRLEKLSQPLLRQIATQAPGTWQHSLTVANLAQTAGAAVGADLQLLRVGAYYHDLGKSLAPKYFLENLGGGDKSVHENLKPTASRDAIFAHVNEGIRVAREAGLPERVIDFIRSHHGGGTLEYFWTLEQATPNGSTRPQDFCYPGTRPQSRETGILCICDAIEGACRNLKNPGRPSIERLVRHIVYGKLRTGQLDECGLSLGDAQRIEFALTESLVQAHAPNAPRLKGADAVSTSPDHPRARAHIEPATGLAQLSEVRLDSLDLPKVGWQQGLAPVAGDSQSGLGFVETETMITEDEDTEDGDPQARRTLKHDAAGIEERITTEQKVEERVTTRRRAEEPVEPEDPEEEADDIEDEFDEDSDPDYEDTAYLGGRRSVQPVLGSEEEDEGEPLLLKSPKRPSGSHATPEALGDWQDALGAAQRLTEDIKTPELPELPGPPPPPHSGARETIPLGKDGLLLEPGPPAKSRAGKRADSSDGMRPGEMVVGAPPATHPERTLPGVMRHDEITAEHYAVMPDEARRPEDRITEENPAVIPPIDAYPETSTEPGPRELMKKKKKKRKS
jgi:putative nucleotidyltransferase with HDIG domain